MRVLANGEAVELPDGAGLLQLFDVLGLGPKWVVAEVNGRAVPRSEMSEAVLSDGDHVELVRAVAGG